MVADVVASPQRSGRLHNRELAARRVLAAVAGGSMAVILAARWVLVCNTSKAIRLGDHRARIPTTVYALQKLWPDEEH